MAVKKDSVDAQFAAKGVITRLALFFDAQPGPYTGREVAEILLQAWQNFERAKAAHDATLASLRSMSPEEVRRFVDAYNTVEVLPPELIGARTPPPRMLSGESE